LARPLIIVESPAKARTLERFLGRRFTIRASKGHLRDLPKSQLGVDVEHGFTPKYITIRGKGETLKELRESARKASRVYLATDPDREGEAISWHLAQVLGIPEDSPVRIVFHEVTPEAVNEALRQPRPIDADLVEAQKARRILDRLVGYELSPLLWRKVRRGLSAGRVQSAALRLIVGREEEIAAFTPRAYYTVAAACEAEGAAFTAVYAGEGGGSGALELDDRERAEEVAARLVAAGEGEVAEVRERQRRRRPAPPFTTSTLQQEASRRLGFSVRRTMSVVQQLYEGEEVPGEGRVGLVTYIRTDSSRVAEPARREAEAFIRATWGEAMAAGGGRRVKDAPQSQGAHEAIRPTSVARRPEDLRAVLRPDAYKLYRLIWERFVASQMADARYNVRTVLVRAAGAELYATASELVFPGFLTLYEEAREEGASAEDGAGHLPPLRQGDRVRIVAAEAREHWTQPPPRFNEATLVKTLEELGIGRPSTYAPIIETLEGRGYVAKRERRLVPTELGRLVDAMLREHFPHIVDPEFTAAMESALDRVERGSEASERLLGDFYRDFHADVARADEAIGRVELPEEVTDVACPECGRPMAVKHGRYGRFLACTGFPECRGSLPYQETTGARCPLCGREVVARRTRRGRTFYGCTGYPACTFTTWNRPAGRDCPRCGAFLVVRRRRGGEVLRCVREECGYEEAAGEAESAPAEGGRGA
jgi:DNA topoisomerase-1